MASHLRASARALHMLGHVLQGMATVVWRFPRLNSLERQQRVQAWASALLGKAGIRLEVIGHPVSDGPALLVANHISWLDIPVMHAARFAALSPRTMCSWPLIGRLATAAGTLYIARSSRRDAQRMVQTMADSLAQGDVLAVFPEGTTGDGLRLLFHSNLLQSAVVAACAGAARGAALCDGGERRSQHRTQLRRRYHAADLHLAHPARRRSGGPGALWCARDGQGRDRRTWSEDMRQRVAALAGLPCGPAGD
jgi:1-acyl-sn-glycerol-3-phosphate acyltransferase